MSETFGRYTVVSQLGRGAMGVVYLATDPVLSRQVALKTVDLSVQEPEEREFLRSRLFRDARAAAVLKHPNIVAIYDIFEDADRAYVVMEYIEGESLAARLKNNPMPDTSGMLKILQQMANALDYTHARGVIHRDIKPANVMIDSTGTTKIMDFGIARISDTRTCTPTGMVMGTVEYMAPEQILGEALDGRADQFALAVVAYQMMTGSTLFGPHTLATLTYKLVNEAPTPPCARNGMLPRGVDAVVGKALSKKPADRFATCSDFVAALSTAFSDAPTAPMAAPAAPIGAQTTVALLPEDVAAPAPARNSRVPITIAALAVLLLGGALAAVIWKPWAQHMPVLPAAKSAVVGAQAPASVEPLQTTGPDALRPPAGATPTPQPAAQTTPAVHKPAQQAAAAKPEPTNPGAVKQDPGKSAAPQAEPPTPAGAVASSAGTAPASMPVEPPAEEFPTIPQEPRTKAGPSPYSQAMQRGMQQLKVKDYADALHAFGDAVQLRPQSPEALFNRGLAFERLQQYDAAMRDFTQALRLKPMMFLANTQLGICLVQLHRDPEAFAQFQRALELNPQAILALFGRANIYLQRKEFAAAIADYNRVLQINPRYAPAYQNRAIARQATGDFAGAAADRRSEQMLRR